MALRRRSASKPLSVIAALATWALAANGFEAERRDIVFDCPCSAERVAGVAGASGTLMVRAGIRNLRATESGAVRLSTAGTTLLLRPIPARQTRRGRWSMAFGEPDPNAVVEVRLEEEPGLGAWTSHETLVLWPVPTDASDGSAGVSPPTRFVDLLTDTDRDGVGDVNERLAGTAPDDAASIPGETEIDLLALYTDDFAEREAGHPYTLLLHAMNVTSAAFEDSATNIRLRMVGMSEVELGESDWVEAEHRQELMDSHGADLTVLFSPTGGCSASAGGCARGGPRRTSHWSDVRVWANLHVGTILVVAHELGHAMGLAHSARQAESYGAWRWSRGHYVTPRGETPRYGTIMAYGRYVLGGVFADPLADCRGVPCGVPGGELDGADAVTTLRRMRFQTAAHSLPAADADGDGIVDAADALPDDPQDWLDVDGDGIGDNADPDDDNDGTDDVDDAFPLDPGEWADADRDGIGDNADEDVQDLSPFRDPALRAAVEEALGKAPGATISDEEMASLTTLWVWGRDIADLTGLDLATSLEVLGLGSGRIEDLTPLSDLTVLRSLELPLNRIVDLEPLSGLSALDWLDLSGNPVTDISPLAGLNINHLLLDDTHVDYADVVALPYFDSLRGLGVAGLGVEDISALGHSIDWVLHLGRNPIADLSPVHGLTALRHLDLSEVGGPDVQWLEPFVNLQTLRLSGNRIVDISPLAGMTALRTLDLGGNRIAEIGLLADMVAMEWLDLGGNAVEDLAPLSAMSGLHTLSLDDNDLADITPLAGMVDMQWLNLSGNRISDISPLESMTGIRNLGLERNSVEDIAPLVDRAIWGGAASSGASLDLDRNPLSDASIDEHIPTLTSWGINVRFWRREGDAPVPAVPDPTLRSLIAEALAEAFAHVDDDRILSGAGNLRRLAIQGRGVASLVGLEAAKGLRSLYATANDVGDLSPLAGLAELGNLDLRDNRIVDLAPLAANANLGAGDSIALDGNPLSEESLNVHVPTLLARGARVSVGRVELALAVGGGPLRYDTAGYFEARLGADFTMSAASDDPSLASVEAADGVLAVTPGAGHGTTSLRVEATGPDGATASLSFTVIVRGAHHAPLFPSASDTLRRQGFARVVNRGPAGEVEIVAVDDTGMRAPPLTLTIGAGETIHFNSSDIETGNVGKGLEGGSGRGTGDWRLELRSSLDIDALAYIRTPDGFLTAMHDIAPRSAGGDYHVPIFNPASNSEQASALRLVNLGGETAQATVTGIDDRGERSADGVRVEIPAGAALTLTAAELEAGGPGLAGRLGNGRGKWRLRVASEGDLAVMNLLASPEGHLTNLSTGAPASLEDDGIHTVPLFTSASDALGRQGFVRVVNRSESRGNVRIRAFDDAGRAYEPLTLSLDAGHVAHFNSDDLELGNARKGLEGSTGSGTGDWRLQLSSELDIEVLAYVRTLSGFLTSMHDLVAPAGRRYDVATFNPGANERQVSRLRVVNAGSQPAHVSVAGVDDGSDAGKEVVRLEVSAGSARTLTAAELESGAGLRGELGEGRGKWRLTVDSEQPVEVMSLLESPTGHLTNLSSRPNR